MIKVKPRYTYLTKSQFVALITQCTSGLPFDIRISHIHLGSYGRSNSLGHLYDLIRLNDYGNLTFAMPASELVGEVGDRIEVRIGTDLNRDHLRNPESLVKDICVALGWLVNHEMQEYIGRNTNLESIIPHGKNKLHMVPRWKVYKFN